MKVTPHHTSPPTPSQVIRGLAHVVITKVEVDDRAVGSLERVCKIEATYSCRDKLDYENRSLDYAPFTVWSGVGFVIIMLGVVSRSSVAEQKLLAAAVADDEKTPLVRS